MDNSNAIRTQQLGMPWGTANAKLRKMILWTLLLKLGGNNCFKCEKPIETIEELSIEHKQPWQGVSADLFWDMNNIAFSHLRCNTPHRPGEGNRKTGKTFHAESAFYPREARWNGLHHHCKAHQKQERAKRVPVGRYANRQSSQT